MAERPPREGVVANDARLVRTRLVRERPDGRINVSSCGFVVTLHGTVDGEEERSRLEALVRGVKGV